MCFSGSGQSVISDAAQAGRVPDGKAGKVYMASNCSSGLSGFLRLGVPRAAPGSPLGGEGMPGVISAAFALSSRNLSNSRER